MRFTQALKDFLQGRFAKLPYHASQPASPPANLNPSATYCLQFSCIIVQDAVHRFLLSSKRCLTMVSFMDQLSACIWKLCHSGSRSPRWVFTFVTRLHSARNHLRSANLLGWMGLDAIFSKIDESQPAPWRYYNFMVYLYLLTCLSEFDPQWVSSITSCVLQFILCVYELFFFRIFREPGTKILQKFHGGFDVVENLNTNFGKMVQRN